VESVAKNAKEQAADLQPYVTENPTKRKKAMPACPIQKKPIFTSNLATMQLLRQTLKITILSSLVFAIAISFTSCEKDAEKKKYLEYLKSGIPMTGAQENPISNSSALGSLDVYYAKNSRTLSYKVTWQGLADTIVGMHIHGVAPAGYSTAIVQNILTTKNEAVFPFRGGTYSGTLLVDGVVIKEENLLNGMYYLNIHTKTYPGGEIRGQIKFQ